MELPGVHRAPNIQGSPEIYEIENAAADPDLRLEQAMSAIAPWDGKVVLDLGAGTGFHTARFYARAQHVIAVEPHDASRLRCFQRATVRGLSRVSIMTGSAERILLPDHSVDIVHARHAYFYPPKCEPGLKELRRVVRPGGTAFIIDNDWRTGTFASWLQRSEWCAGMNADVIEAFWQEHGYTLTRVASECRFANRADLENVLSIEFPPNLLREILREHAGLRFDYHYCLYHRRF